MELVTRADLSLWCILNNYTNWIAENHDWGEEIWKRKCNLWNPLTVMSNSSAGNAEVSSCIVVHLAVQFCSFYRPCGKKRQMNFMTRVDWAKNEKRSRF